MVTAPEGHTPACTHQCRPPRHLHPSTDLAALGIPCRCGANSWHLHTGGPLPTRVVCGACLHGADLEQLLRRIGRPRPDGPQW